MSHDLSLSPAQEIALLTITAAVLLAGTDSTPDHAMRQATRLVRLASDAERAESKRVG